MWRRRKEVVYKCEGKARAKKEAGETPEPPIRLFSKPIEFDGFKIDYFLAASNLPDVWQFVTQCVIFQ
jgi:hypothetical protein